VSGSLKPDPERLAAARGAARDYVRRKQAWIRGLFFVAAASELAFFGAMLALFEFSDRFHWFLFCGFSFVYCPLIMFVFRTTVMVDRMYYRLLWELKYEERSDASAGEDEALSFEADVDEQARDEVRTFLEQKRRRARLLFIAASFFELTLFTLLLYLMDFTSRQYWFLFCGFLGVYSPLIMSTWRNAFAIDRVYYGLIDELKYGGR